MTKEMEGWSAKTKFLLCNALSSHQLSFLEVSKPKKHDNEQDLETTEYAGHGGFDVIDHAFGPGFPCEILHELRSHGWIENESSGSIGFLSPARTKMEVDVDTILNQWTTTTSADDVTKQQERQRRTFARGDEAAFISRKERSESSFPERYPALHRLITSIETTAVGHLEKRPFAIDSTWTQDGDGGNGEGMKLGRENDKSGIQGHYSVSALSQFEFDLDMTSVQIARYPGDGRSGYPRHCDRGKSCAMESSLLTPDTTKSESVGRILTFVYYLTPSDWDAQLDGGALRIFPPYLQDFDEDSKTHSRKNDGHSDVIPYPDRLVVFRSDVLEHQVLPSLRRDRIAITVWLYGRIISSLPCLAESSAYSMHSLQSTRKNLSFNNEKCSTINIKDFYNDCQRERKNEHIIVNNTIHDSRSPPPLQLPTNHHLYQNNANAIIPTTETSTIFVSIPSYRDRETWNTIKSLIQNAHCPGRVTVGVVWQVDTTSQEEVDRFTDGKDTMALLEDASPSTLFSWNRKTNFRSIMMDYRHATGPCYARHLAQTLHRGEDYVLHIDSHMRFRQNWDEYLIRQLEKCYCPLTQSLPAETRLRNYPPRAVLTTYPPGYELDADPGPNAEIRGTILVPWKFDEDGMLRQKGRLIRSDHRHIHLDPSNVKCQPMTTTTTATTTTTTPSNHNKCILNDNIPCLLYAAGFNFFHSSLLEVCPYDHKLHGLFFGEEISMAIRLYTHGYDLFAPPETVCYHLWKRNPLRNEKDRNEYGSHGSKRYIQREASLEAVRSQLRGEGKGLGDVRSVSQFARELGVDFEKRSLSPGCENAGLSCDAFLDTMSNGGTDLTVRDSNGAGTPNDEMSLVLKLVGEFMVNK